jgi:curved DNA-binding protein CbpA
VVRNREWKNTVRMECNKDEAVRSKEIAEKKFMEMDISGAKRYALKAQSLYPGLDGLPQFLQTLDVYICAEKRINGEVDWYGVLGVKPFADDDMIRKHYRKLALILHPDKNKSVGADGAFKILSQAWSFLSDKAKRIVYDQKRNLRDIYEKDPDRKSSAPAAQNGFTNLSNSNNLYAKNQKGATNLNHARAPEPLKPTFWTVCNSCNMHFEYLRTYLNYTLVCPNCHKPFKAYESPPPIPFNGSGSPPSRNSYMRRQNSCPQTVVKNQYASGNIPTSATTAKSAGFSASVSSKRTFQPGAFSKSGGVASVPLSTSSAAQATGVFEPTSEQLKRRREDAAAAAMREEAYQGKNHATKKTGAGFGSFNAGSSSVQKGDRPKKQRRIDEYRMFNKGREMANQMAMEKGVNVESASGSQKGSFETGRMKAAGSHRPIVSRELSQLEMRNMLMEKAKKEIRKKLNEWSSASVSKPLHKLKTSQEDVGEKGTGEKKPAVNGVKADKCREFEQTNTTKKSSPANSSVNFDTNGADPMSMSVPDPDFHDFDKDRTEKSFGDNQVWAAYDDDDGMPRYYAMIHSVISRKPFKMRISWLNSKSNDELAPLNWIGSGFYKTSGDFRIGKHEINRSLNSFSHKVKWTKGIRGAIQIYPVKGDVWALYRNWSPDWNELTPDEVIHKYDMVEVLEDYNEEQGVPVVPLVKVPGFRGVFRCNEDPGKIRTIPRAEMFRFSHQVPSYLLTGQEGQNAPKDCWEIDPAAAPLELLHAVADAQKEEVLDNAENSENARGEDPLGRMEKPKEEERVENGKTTKEKGLVGDIGRKFVAEIKIKGKEMMEEKVLVYNRRRLREGKMLESAK